VAARTEHFSRAADELHLTHGAISRAVRLLRRIWGSRCSNAASAGSC
jgi:DNA-binding transcriptional LysR family regulator